ncbi:hypothetical protein GQ85_08210 [Rhodococcus rhodochrous]|nr:hypothetical protein GQ85_08210 [Rhodococcus rhodochrous]
MWRLVAIAVIGTVALSGCGSGAGGSGGGAATLRYGSGLPDTIPLAKTDIAGLDAITQADSSITWNKNFGGALVDLPETLAAIQDGRLDAGYLSDGVVAQQLPLWSVVQIPFETSDPIAAARALQELYETNDDFRKMFEDQKIHVLHFLPIGPSIVGTDDKISSTDDLEGQRVRAFGLLGVAAKNVGADPVDLPFAELYDALQRKVVDGFIGMSFDTGQASGFYKLKNHVTDMRTGLYASGLTAMNLDKYNSLSDEQRTAIDGVTDDFYTGVANDIVVKAESDACMAAKADGVTLAQIDEDAAAAWKSEVGDAVVRAWMKQVVAAGVDEAAATAVLEEYRVLVAKYSADSPYVNGVGSCLGG